MIALSLVAMLTGCGSQGATVGGYPFPTTATPVPGGGATTTPGGGATATPSGGATATPSGGGATATPTGGGATATPSGGGATATPSGGATATPSGGATATPSGGASPTPTASATASSSAAAGSLIVAPNPINFGVTSVLGSSSTATISQTNYAGPFTLPANAIVCANGITNIPVTATITGSTLTVTLGALGVTGSCTIAIDGAPGTQGFETVNLAVPIGTVPQSGVITFSPDPVIFNVLNGVTGSTATSTVSETGYSGAFTLPSGAINCPFNLLPLTQLTAGISGNVVTLTTGLLNANLLGSCTVTVDDSKGNSGQLVVDFQLL